MAFTGDLEHLHIVDIIQLIHTTRKSGTFSVKGSRGESRIIFYNGYIVGANHLNIRIGTVLVKMNAISPKDLEKALEAQKKVGINRKPLIATLIEMGKLSHEEASKGLKKLIEMTIVELMGWKEGVFTFDTEVIAVSPECNYSPADMEQEVTLDAQMVLMDALRIFDERERDRMAGKNVQPFEDFFKDVIPSKDKIEDKQNDKVITPEDLGLSEIGRLKKKLPRPFSVKEIFDPVEIHRQNIKENLENFSDVDQGTLVSFLNRFTKSSGVLRASSKIRGEVKSLVFFSSDKLIKHSLMTICKNDGYLVFATDVKRELDNIIDQCISKKIQLILVLDYPVKLASALFKENILSIRNHIKERYPQTITIQLISPFDYNFMIQSFNGNVKAVFPRPLKEFQKETFIEDTIKFLETFRAYINVLFEEKKYSLSTDIALSKIKEQIMIFQKINEPPDLSLAILQSVSEIFERSITFIVRQGELIGEKAYGINNDKKAATISVSNLRIPLTKSSIFRNIVENGQIFYGEINDEILEDYLFEKIGAPLRTTILLLPVKSRGKTMILTYGDFGISDVNPVQIDILEIVSTLAGLVLENIIFRKYFKKTAPK